MTVQLTAGQSPPMGEETSKLLNRVIEDALHSDRNLFDSLSLHERQIVVEWMSEAIVTGETRTALHEALWEIDYLRKPVGIKEFLESEEYIGLSMEGLYPLWKDVLCHVLDPKSAIVEFILTGAIGIGKCLDGQTYVNTADGFVRLRDLHGKEGQLTVQAESGMRPVVATHDEGETDTLRVLTKHGHTIEGRPTHRLRVLRDLVATWVMLKDLREGDCVLMTPARTFGTDPISADAAELVGWYIAEGVHVANHASSGVTYRRLTLHRDEVPYIIKLARRVGGKHGSVRSHNRHGNGAEVTVSGAAFRAMFPQGRAWEKTIPDRLMRAPRGTICRLLRGLFSGDGYSGMCDCSLTTTSVDLAEQVRVLLVALGMYCSVTSKRAVCVRDGVRKTCRRAYTVRVVGAESQRQFAREVGFAQPAKQRQLESRLSKRTCNQDHSFAFHLSAGDADALQRMQPKYHRGHIPPGLRKATSPSRMWDRVKRGQAVTRRLLQHVKAHGQLPPVLDQIADGTLMFDTVASVTPGRSHCYDLSVGDDPSYVGGGFISHNTFVTTAAMAYKVYLLSCLRDPAKYYGLSSRSKIVFGFYAVTKKQAADVGYYQLRSYFDHSTYFQQYFPYNPRLETKTQFMKQPIEVMFGSRAMHSLGVNLLGFAIDEANFFQDKKSNVPGAQATNLAKELYDSASSRLYSRFMRPGGIIPGLICLPSSRNAQNSFLEEIISKKKGSRHVYIADYSQWEVKGAHKFFLPKIKVQVGDRTAPSKVLHNPEAFDLITRFKTGQINEAAARRQAALVDYGKEEKPKDGMRIIDVPGEFMEKFIEDPDQALRDIAGVATFNVSPFIRDRASVFDCVRSDMTHPFSVNTCVLDYQDDFKLEEIYEYKRVCRIVNSKWTPKFDPRSLRYIHVDLSATGDSTGIAMCHASHTVKIRREMPDGTVRHIKYPYIVLDFAMRIDAPPGSEIDHGKIRSFIFFLRDLFPIKSVTYDGWQSISAIQTLRKEGFSARVLSCDLKEDPYMSLRSAFSERRFGMYNYEPLIDELLDLQRDIKKNKIDHPVKATKGGKGRKDVADAVAGAFYDCIEDEDALHHELVDDNGGQWGVVSQYARGRDGGAENEAKVSLPMPQAAPVSKDGKPLPPGPNAGTPIPRAHEQPLPGNRTPSVAGVSLNALEADL